MANRYKGKCGFYLFKFNYEDPSTLQQIIIFKNNLPIDDVSLKILRGEDETTGHRYKELVIGFKTIYLNTYQVIFSDLSGNASTKENGTLYRYETFHLWESSVDALIMDKNKDFVILTKDGMQVLNLSHEPKKILMDYRKQPTVIHSLDSPSFLKLEPCNFIHFKFLEDNDREITVFQEYQRKVGNSRETRYEKIYSIKINDLSLRELNILQGFYICKDQEINKLVKLQPNPSLFFKTFLELDLCNFTTILAFNSSSIEHLLSSQHEQYFIPQYPIIYKSRFQKKNNKNRFYFNTAIDQALKNNQIKAVSFLLDYIVKYQNNYVSSYLFKTIFPKLIEKGIPLHDLLHSNVFMMELHYDEWIMNHTDESRVIKPYQDSVFSLRHSYNKVFPEFESIEEMKKNGKKIDRVFKVKYTVNLLPSVGEYVYMVQH